MQTTLEQPSLDSPRPIATSPNGLPSIKFRLRFVPVSRRHCCEAVNTTQEAVILQEIPSDQSAIDRSKRLDATTALTHTACELLTTRRPLSTETTLARSLLMQGLEVKLLDNSAGAASGLLVEEAVHNRVSSTPSRLA